jgi:ATP diphosphatase
VRAKIDEELAEADGALKQGQPQALADEIGDLLFTVANWARHLGVDPENALQRASLKFEQRFERMERGAERAKLSLTQLSAAQWEQLWQAAKSLADKP